MASLRDRYDIKSNRQSGKGLFDATLVSNEKTNNGIVFEFKVVESEVKLDTSLAANQCEGLYKRITATRC